MMIFPILKQRIIPKPAKYILVFRTISIEKNGLLQGRLFSSFFFVLVLINTEQFAVALRLWYNFALKRRADRLSFNSCSEV